MKPLIELIKSTLQVIAAILLCTVSFIYFVDAAQNVVDLNLTMKAKSKKEAVEDSSELKRQTINTAISDIDKDQAQIAEQLEKMFAEEPDDDTGFDLDEHEARVFNNSDEDVPEIRSTKRQPNSVIK